MAAEHRSDPRLRGPTDAAPVGAEFQHDGPGQVVDLLAGGGVVRSHVHDERSSVRPPAVPRARRLGSISGVTVTIVGCGYVGERIAKLVIGDGATVRATTRRPDRAKELANAGIEAHVVDPKDVPALASVIAGTGVLVSSVPPGADGDATPSIARAATDAEVGAFVYLGSTGVYPAHAGNVDEESAVEERGRGAARLIAERSLRDIAARTGLRVTILRIAAIYGPGRGIHARLRAGTYRVPGDGDNHVSRVHVDDLARIALAAGRAQLLDPSGAVRLYTVADEAPTTARAHADGVAAVLGLPPPQSMPLAEAPPTLRGDRRVSSARLRRELGFTFRYPTWREGLRQCLQEEATTAGAR